MRIPSTRILAACSALIVLAALIPWPEASITKAKPQGDQPIIARGAIEDHDQLLRFVTLGLDLLETRDGDDLFILTTHEQIERLRDDGWRIRVDDEMTTQTMWLSPETFLDGYRTVAEMRAQLEASAAIYPNLAEFFIYGQSWEKASTQGQSGHDLFGVRLTTRSKAGPKPVFFLMAAIHARELTTSEIALRLVDHLLVNYGVDGDVTWLLDEHQIVIIPMVNPDGRVVAERGLLQRKNTNTTHGGACSNPPLVGNQFGVDLNRNYSFRWGVVNAPTEPPCGQTFPGLTPASEPETAAIQDLVRSLFPDQRGPNDTDAAPMDATGVLITLHSFGNLALWPWGSTRTKAPNATELELIGGKLASYNGHTPQQSIELYPTSGTTDEWSYGELGVASFTFEIGPANGPCGGFFAPYSCLDGGVGGEFWPRNLPALLYAARIARTPYQLVHGPTPESLIAALNNNGQVELRAVFDETGNGSQAIVAAEFYVDVPPWCGGVANQMIAADGVFDSAAERATALVNSASPRSLFYVRARDAAGNWGPVRAAYISRQIAGDRERDRIIRPMTGRNVQPTQ